MRLNKKVMNFIVIALLSLITFFWTFSIFHTPFSLYVVATVIIIRMFASRFVLRDYSLSWSKATQKTFLIKSFVYIVAFLVYMPLFYGKITIAFFISELFLYIFALNFLMYLYYYVINKSKITKTKDVVIYGAGRAGMKLESEFADSEFKVRYFIDDDPLVQNRSIDAIEVISSKIFQRKCTPKYDLLVIAMPSVNKARIKDIYEELGECFEDIKVLPSLDEILRDKDFSQQLKKISLEDLLARHPQDLDREKIEEFVQGKVVLITGAGGSIGSELCRQCQAYGAKHLVLLDHSEYNLYAIAEELKMQQCSLVLQNITDKESIEKTFARYKPEIVLHAAAYKHVPIVEANVSEGIHNNIIGTKNIIDTSIAQGVHKVVMLSSDKAVRPTNVMGATKRICELYAQNSNGLGTEIVAVRFGNVLGSSGSVIPKFTQQIEEGGPITVTHPEITRYFMLIPEACELVLQAGAIGQGGEIFILDMGEPVKIVDLAKKMIELSGKKNIEIKFSGLRPGEKLYEELLLDDAEYETQYDSITVAKPTPYERGKLIEDIETLIACEDKLKKLKEIVPEFQHNKHE